VLRDSTQDEEIGKRVDHIDALELAIHTDRQAFACELVDDVEHAVSPALMGAVLEKVVRPDVVWPFWPKTDAGIVS